MSKILNIYSKMSFVAHIKGSFEIPLKKEYDLPFIEEFAREIGVDAVTLWRWKEKYPRFCKAIRKQQLQEEFINEKT